MGDLDVRNSMRHKPYAQGQESHGVEKMLISKAGQYRWRQTVSMVMQMTR